MSAHQLSVIPLDAVHTGPGVPVHACFASEQDVLAVLFEHGAFALWDLRTRLGPGPGKAVDPVLLWDARAEAGSETRWRQVLVLPRIAPAAVSDSESTAAHERVPWPLALLGHRAGVDIVAVRGPTAAEERTIELPEHNGRLVPGGKPGEVWWQASGGRILDGERAPRSGPSKSEC
jgi:elongator complex protein 1